MRYTVETSLRNFEAWAGAEDTIRTLSENGDIDSVENCLNEIFLEEDPTETEINDILRFETDTIAKWLGYQTWEHYEDPCEYVCNEIRDNISEDDLELFEKVNGDLHGYIYATRDNDELKNVGKVIDEIEDLIDELKETEDNEQEND